LKQFGIDEVVSVEGDKMDIDKLKNIIDKTVEFVKEGNR